MHIAEPERDRLRAACGRTGRPLDAAALRRCRTTAASRSPRPTPAAFRSSSPGARLSCRTCSATRSPLRNARLAAERITAKNVELRTARGIEPVHLAVGLASWRIGGLACTAPVLLRPLGIRRHHADFELKLHGSFTVNPELVRALRTHFGIELDGAGARRTRLRRRRVQAAAGDRPPPRADRVDRLVHRAAAPGRLDLRRRRRRDGAGCRGPRPSRAQRARRSPGRPRER